MTEWDICLEVLAVLGLCGEKMVKRPIVMPGVPFSERSARFTGSGV